MSSQNVPVTVSGPVTLTGTATVDVPDAPPPAASGGGWVTVANDTTAGIWNVAAQTTYCPGIRNSSGVLVCAIQLPASGVGVFTVRSEVNMILQNNGTSTARVCFGIGVTDPSQSSNPQYPYWGWSHNRCDKLSDGTFDYITLAPGEAKPISLFRVDTVDIARIAGIPNWPNWTMNKSSNGNYPRIVASAGVVAGSNVVARDVRMMANSV